MEINKDGIRVKREKNMIYFLFATEPLTFILFFIEFFTSLKIIPKKTISRIILTINKLFKLLSFNEKKLLSMKVKKVKKPMDNVNMKIIIINRFLFKKVNIS